ncbi:MAG: hypothetical protein E7638_05370 [Ruminococcaceae bacterium]|nr:hypothetical protein [Oscillospiraceae bacterium]
MKKITVSLLLAALICGSLFLSSCDKGGSETSETLQSDFAETETIEKDGPKNDMTSFTFQSLTTSMKMELIEDSLYITSLKTESGVEKVSSAVPFALPQTYCTYKDAENSVSDGDKDFKWCYVGYEEYTDDDEGKGYIFTFKDADMEVFYRLFVVERPLMAGPFEFFAYIDNKTEGTLLCTPNDYFTVSVSGNGDPVTMTFDKESGVAEGWNVRGTYFDGSGIYETTLLKGIEDTAYVSTHQNFNAGGFIPMIYVDWGDSGVYYVLEWSNGTLTARGTGEGGALLSVCLDDGSFYTNLPEGDSLYMPSVYLGAYDGDVDTGSNIYKHWFLRYKAPDNMFEDENEPLTQQDMQLGISVAQYGIQQIKWDYGWWSDEIVTGMWRTNEGLLEVHNSAYLDIMQSVGASTLAEFVAKAKEAGVNVTTYVLLKDTELDREGVPTSVGEFGRPEWFSNICITGVGDSADLGNEECVEFYKDYLYNFFKETGVNTWRSDFEPICRESDQENRHFAFGNDVQYWCTVGFGELVDHLIENIDGFRYESCSSGGSMKDPFTMTKASVINCDDSADFMSLHMTFYDSSYCIHPAQLQLPCNALTYTPGSPYYAGIGDYLYGFRCTLTGGVMLSNWNGTTEEDISYWPYYVNEVYNKIMKPLIRHGDLYHILPRPDGIHWDGLQYIDADSENVIKGLVMLWKPTDTEGPEKTVYLRGLEADTMYKLTFEDRPEQNCEVLGSELMTNGLTVIIEGESGSEMIWISEAE